MTENGPRRLRNPNRVRRARARLPDSRAEAQVGVVRAIICEPTRTRIFRALGAGPLTVSDLAAAVDRSRPAVSQHLRVLRAEGVVSRTARGRSAYYALTQEPLARTAARVLHVLMEAAVA